MGRKRKEKTKLVQISFRVTKEQKEILEMIADYSGMTLSDLMRALALDLILKFKFNIPIQLPQVDIYDLQDNVYVSKEKEG